MNWLKIELEFQKKKKIKTKSTIILKKKQTFSNRRFKLRNTHLVTALANLFFSLENQHKFTRLFFSISIFRKETNENPRQNSNYQDRVSVSYATMPCL